MNTFLRTILRLSILPSVAACSATDADRADRLILGDGLVDIAVIEGSELTDNCGFIVREYKGADYKCIAFPMNDRNQWIGPYMEMLEANGWEHTGGAANGYDYRKAINDQCVRKLQMGVSFQATAEQEARYWRENTLDGVDTALLAFFLLDEARCRSDGPLR